MQLPELGRSHGGIAKLIRPPVKAGKAGPYVGYIIWRILSRRYLNKRFFHISFAS